MLPRDDDTPDTPNAWELLTTPEGRAKLEENPGLVKYILELDIDAEPDNEKLRGTTVAWWLTLPINDKSLLSNPRLLRHFLSCSNIDASPVEGEYAGQSAAFNLVEYGDNTALLGANPELLEKLLTCNMSSAPTQGKNLGRTVGWRLAGRCAFCQLPVNHPKLLEYLLSCDMNHAPTCGTSAGVTAAYLFADGCENPNTPLLQEPRLLLNFLTCDMNRHVSHPMMVAILGKLSVADVLKQKENFPIFLKHAFLVLPSLLTIDSKNLNALFKIHNGLPNDAALMQQIEKMKQSLKASAERALAFARSTKARHNTDRGLEDALFDEIFFQEHPDLVHLRPTLAKNINWRTDLCSACGIDVAKIQRTKKAENMSKLWQAKHGSINVSFRQACVTHSTANH